MKWIAIFLAVMLLAAAVQQPAVTSEIIGRKGVLLSADKKEFSEKYGEDVILGIMYLKEKAAARNQETKMEVLITDMKVGEAENVWYFYYDVSSRESKGAWISSKDVILAVDEGKADMTMIHGIQVDKKGDVWGDIAYPKEIERVYIGSIGKNAPPAVNDKLDFAGPGLQKSPIFIIALFNIIIKLLTK